MLLVAVAALWLQGTSSDARALLDSANARLYRAPFDTAAAWFIRARHAAQARHDSAATAEAMLRLALVRLRSRSPQVALPLIDSAAPFVGKQNLRLQSLFHCLRAAVLVTRGDAATESAASLGLELARRDGHRAQEAECLDMVGWHYLNMGEHTRAAAMFDSAVTISATTSDYSTRALALWWRGNHALELYAHDAAQRDLTAALAEAERAENRFVAGWAWLRLAVISWQFSDFVSARAQLARGRALLDELGDLWGMGYARMTAAGLLLDAGDVAAAERALAEDLAWAQGGGLPLEVFSARFGLARVAMRRRDWTTAEREFVAAERVALTSGLSGYVSQLDYERGLLALRQGDFGAAERRFRSALALKSGANQLDRYAARSRLAYLYVLRNDLDAAERELRVATRELDSLRATLGERGRRVQAFQVRKGYDEADAGFATIVSGLAAGNRVPIARDLAERRRARELLGDLTRLGAATDSSFVDPSLHAHIASDERTALLEYVTGNDQPTTLFVSVGDSTTAYRLPSIDSLAADVASFGELLEAGAGAQALARSLGERVLGPVLRSLPSTITRLVVVPDGILHRIPFDALLTPNGQAVVERFTVSVVPSAGVLAKLQLLRDDARRSRVLALGDPQFEHERPVARGSVTETYREAFAGSGGLVRLPASAREARLAARFGARSLVRLRSRASEAFLKQAADSFDIIHFATHALVDDRSPSRTALALAPGAGDDGFAGAQELAALKLNAQLVVLSACRTARGALVAGEGVQGLTAPILQAGARAIVASQWRVEDRRTVPFIEDFYRALAAGQNVGDALREAKLSAMRRGEAPGVWAAFTLVGNPLVTVSLRSPRSVPFPVILLVSLGLVAGYGVWMRKRRGVARTSEPSASRAATVQ